MPFAPGIRWTGKILPHSWVTTTEMNSDRDLEMVLQLLEDVDLETAESVNWNSQKADRLRKNAQILVEAFKERFPMGQTHFKVRTTKNGYRLVDKDLSQKEGLKTALESVGVGMKPQKGCSALAEDMKQPEPRGREQRVRKYEDWIHQLVHREPRAIMLPPTLWISRRRTVCTLGIYWRKTCVGKCITLFADFT